MTLQHSAACHANQSCVSTELAVRIRDTLPAGKTLASSHSWPGIQNPSLPIQLPGQQEDLCAWNLDSILLSICFFHCLGSHAYAAGVQLVWVPYVNTDIDRRAFLMHGHH